MIMRLLLNLLVSIGPVLCKTLPARHQPVASTPPSPLEVAANSHIPNIALPDKINKATTTLLQLMTIWGQAETFAYEVTIDKVTSNATGYTEFSHWNRIEMLFILNTNLAVPLSDTHFVRAS
jgi:hypothetical protein